MAGTVRELSDGHALKHLLKASGLSRSTCCYNLKQRPERYANERKRIKEIHAGNLGRYGYRRIDAQLRNEGFAINHKTICRIMKEENLENVRRHRKYRSYRGDVGKTAPKIVPGNGSSCTPTRDGIIGTSAIENRRRTTTSSKA